MELLVGVGSSNDIDPKEAVDEAFKKSIVSLQKKEPSFILILASQKAYRQEILLENLKKLSPNSVIIGCSTSGEITSDGPTDNSVAIMTIYSDEMKFIPGVGNNIEENARQAGKSFAEDIMKNARGEIPKAALIFPDGLAGNGADIVRGILDVFGNDFVLAGGSAGDDFEFKKTYEYFDNQVLSGSVVGVGLYGNFNFGIGVRHGWIPIGTSRRVTKSESNILYEIDNKPAIQIYEEQFGKDKTMISITEPLAKLAITYPLGIVYENSNEYLIRDPITVDKNGAITCAAEVPKGSEVYIMIGSREEAINAAEEAAKKAVSEVPGNKIKAVFLFNCIARKKLLMDKKKEEIERIQNVFGKNIPLIGFYTYGEQAPLEMDGKSGICCFHNETDVIFALAA